MMLGNVELPALPEGQRWYITHDIIGSVVLNLQERKSFLGIKYWKTICWSWIHGPSDWHVEYAVMHCLNGENPNDRAAQYRTKMEQERARTRQAFGKGEVK